VVRMFIQARAGVRRKFNIGRVLVCKCPPALSTATAAASHGRSPSLFARESATLALALTSSNFESKLNLATTLALGDGAVSRCDSRASARASDGSMSAVSNVLSTTTSTTDAAAVLQGQ